jgi:tetratricopeptide (TPR) repeat protein
VIALRERLLAEHKISISFTCSPLHTNSPFFPFIAQLRRAADFGAKDTSETRITRLESLLAEAVPDPSEAIALFAELLGIAGAIGYEPPAMSPLEKKARLFRAFLAQFDGLAAREPLLIVLEDAHWLDPTSRELLDQIIDRVQRWPALLVVTFRPELSPDWIGFPHVTLLTLNRLAQAQVRSLVERVTGNKKLPSEVLDQILARTEGVPLFAEELTKAVVESGVLRDAGDQYILVGPLPALAIPASLHDSLLARLDRLSSVKEIAQIGACIGREFDHELLAVVASISDQKLLIALERLVAAELIFRRGVAPEITYLFKHALVRDAAYESLLKTRRQEIHARIATAIEAHFPQILQTQPELVARHFGEARLAEKSIGYWLQAGRASAARSANVEAIAHLRAGLKNIHDLPPGSSRSKLELSLQLALGGPLLATKGFASREAEAAYRRAEELSRELQNEADLFTALRGLGYVYHVRANLRDASRLVTEVIDLARRSGDPARLAEAHFFAGTANYHLGAFQTARDWFEQSMAAGEYRGRYHSEVYGINMGVFCRAYVSHCDWHLGYPDRALQTAEAGLTLAREASHPFSIALALNYLAMLHEFRREPEAAVSAAEEARDICAEYRFDYYGAWSAIIRAWAVTEQGRLDDGLAAYDAALDVFRATGAGLRMPHYLNLLAAIYRRAGQHSTGLRIIDEARAIAGRNNENWCDAQLSLERGVLLLAIRSDEACKEADSAIQLAIEIAAAQGAKLVELRATTSAARYWAQRGEQQRARDMLLPIYGWFTEGFDTLDQKEAKALLDALSS